VKIRIIKLAAPTRNRFIQRPVFPPALLRLYQQGACHGGRGDVYPDNKRERERYCPQAGRERLCLVIDKVVQYSPQPGEYCTTAFDAFAKNRKPTTNVIPVDRYPETSEGYKSSGPRLSPA